MIVFVNEFETKTMFFENKELATIFFFKFKEHLVKFLELQEKNMHSSFTIEPFSSRLKFVWVFRDREIYEQYIEIFNKCDFRLLTHKLGWEQVKRKSYNFQ